MNAIHLLVLSIIEGVTEFLPVSSTGHLILASKLLRIPDTEFIKSFEIIIQLGAIMAVVSLYAGKIIRQPELIKPMLLAFLPTGIVGLLLYPFIKTCLLGNDMVVVAALMGIGVLLICLEQYWKTHPAKETVTVTGLSMPALLSIGLYQSFSMIPGVSRAAATIVGGKLMGLSRRDAVEFSFLLAIPTMAAATGLDLLRSTHTLTAHGLGLIGAGFVVSWITAFAVIRTFIRFVTRATFTGFGIYRIAVGLAYWAMMSL